MKKIAILDPVHHSLKAKLSENYTVIEHIKPSLEDLNSLICDVHGIILRSSVKLTRDQFSRAKYLQVIGRAGVGVDNIDLDCAKEKNVTVFNVPSQSANSVAEFTFGLMLAISRKVCLAERQTRAGIWKKPELIGNELSNKVLGIVGVGAIGKNLARMANGFNMRVIGSVSRVTPERKDEYYKLGISLVDNNEIFSRADYVCLNLPLTDSTKHLVNKSTLKTIKPSSFIINTARGGIVDDDALIEALDSGELAGYATDVPSREGGMTPFSVHDNAIVTPHIGAMTDEAQENIATLLFSYLEDAFAGREVTTRIV